MCVQQHLLVLTGELSQIKPTSHSPSIQCTCRPSMPCMIASRVKHTRDDRECTMINPPDGADNTHRTTEDGVQNEWTYTHYDPKKDIERICSNLEELNMCCYYHGGLTSPQAKSLLRHSKIGTFLVRDSSDPKYLYSLSLKTEKGTTSVRIEYSHGRFILDCEPRLRVRMPRFNTVVQLIDNYVTLSQSESSKQCRWLESSGRRDVEVNLCKPKYSSVPSLQHLARLTINNCVELPKLAELPLPNRMKQFIRDYPYKH